jgi:hypothetical protein
MKKIVRLTESDLARIVRRVINEQASGFASTSPGVEIAFQLPGMNNLYYDCKSGKVSDSNSTDVSDRATLSSGDRATLTKWCTHKGTGHVK